jgi:hypothetical protein
MTKRLAVLRRSAWIEMRTCFCFLALLALLSSNGKALDPTVGIYPYVWKETTGQCAFFVKDNAEFPLIIDERHSNAMALHSLNALKYSVVCGNAGGVEYSNNIKIIGYFSDHGKFVLLNWVIPLPFVTYPAADGFDPIGISAKKLRRHLSRDDFRKTAVFNPNDPKFDTDEHELNGATPRSRSLLR